MILHEDDMDIEIKPEIMKWLDIYLIDYFAKHERTPQSIELHPHDCVEILSHRDMIQFSMRSVEYQFKHPEVMGIYRGIRIIANPKIPIFRIKDSA